jgi:hypothetical protein
VSLVARFRRAAGEERQQIKWVVYAVVFTVAYFILGQLFLQDLLPGAVEQILFLVSLESLWIAIAVAILGYHLYDIDLLINRTLVYGAVTAVLAAVYLGTVIVLEYTFRAATGGEPTRRRSLHSRHSGAVQPFAPPRAGVRGPALLPQQVRRPTDARNLLGYLTLRDGPGAVGRRPGDGRQEDHAARARQRVAARAGEGE